MEEIENVEIVQTSEQTVEKSDEKKEELHAPVERANLVKRVIAGIIDLFVAVFLYLMLQSFVIFPIAKACAPQYNQNYQTIISYYEDSGLATINDKDGKIEQLSEDKYFSATQQYYNVYCSSDTGTNACKAFGEGLKKVIESDENIKKEYYSAIDENGDITFSDKYKDDAEFIKQFNAYIYSKALSDLQTSDLFKTPLKYVSTVQNISSISTAVISLAITYLLIPIINYKGQTLGKITFKLALTNQQGYKVKKSQIVVRFLAFSVINIFLGFVTMMIVPLISFAIMVFSKKNCALHDYCAVTMVVDDKASIIYDNKEQHMKAVEDENDKFLAIEKRREEYYNEQNNQKK